MVATVGLVQGFERLDANMLVLLARELDCFRPERKSAIPSRFRLGSGLWWSYHAV